MKNNEIEKEEDGLLVIGLYLALWAEITKEQQNGKTVTRIFVSPELMFWFFAYEIDNIANIPIVLEVDFNHHQYYIETKNETKEEDTHD